MEEIILLPIKTNDQTLMELMLNLRLLNEQKPQAGIIVIYQQSILALWIFIEIYFIMNKLKKDSNKKSKIILYFDNLSFYIYIVHIMFMTGPIRLMGITNSFLLDSIIALDVLSSTFVISPSASE